jgi:hypothetical protein
MWRAGHTGFTAGLCRRYFSWRHTRRAFAGRVDHCALQRSIIIGKKQKARREAGLCVEGLNRRQPVAGAIS